MKAPRNFVGRAGGGTTPPGNGLRALAVAALALICFGPAAATGAAGATTGPDSPTLVLTQVPASGPIPADHTEGPPGHDFLEGGRLVVVPPGGSPRVLTPDFASAADPEVSFDGTRILFAGRRTATDPWCIHEMRANGGAARLVTCGPGSARSPIYLTDMHTLNPTSTDTWTQIAFVGARPGEVNESGKGTARSLYTCLLDGTVTRRLTYNLSSDLDPALLPDGRLVYASWQRHDLGHGPDGRVVLLAVNMDGTDMVPYVTGEGRRARRTPAATAGGLVVFIEADAPAGDGAGRLASVAQRRPLHTYRSLTTPGEGLFLAPAALPDGQMLVSMRPAGGGDHAVYRLDPSTGRRAKLFDARGWHDVQAKRLAPRPARDGRSSPVQDDDPAGKLYVIDVGINDLPEGALSGGGTARLRVLEGLPRRAATTSDAPLAARRLLVEAPIATDGSAQVLVPANTPLMLQVVDGDGLAQRGGAWIWARNHYEQGCIGCHEDPERTPPNRFVKAIQSPGAPAAPPALRRTVDFRNDILPIIRARCAACHLAGGSPPSLDAAGDDAAVRAVYRDLIGTYVEPGRARTSRLIWHLLGRNTARPWDGPVAARPVRGMPEGGAALSVDERRLFIEWVDFGAAWDARPDAAGADAASGAGIAGGAPSVAAPVATPPAARSGSGGRR